MKVLLCASEIHPLAKTGGLADVVGSMAPELASLGHDIRLVMPLHGCVRRDQLDLQKVVPLMGVPVGPTEQWCVVWETKLPHSSVPVYLIEHEQYFGRSALYQWEGRDYSDNAERFIFFSRACCQLCKALHFQPDIIHCHDWQTALVPVYLKTLERGHPLLSAAASVMSIHNLGYQGQFSKEEFPLTQLGWEHFSTGGLEFFDQMNFLKAGILFADKVATVSPNYAREIQTAEGGFGLDGVLRSRSADLVGILNGLDYREWNPADDPHLPAAFDVDQMAGKAVCKAALQKRFQLAVRPEVPIVCLVSRLVYQKGVDALASALPKLMALDLQFVVLGTGEIWAHFHFGELPNRYPGKGGAFIGFNNELAHLIHAGSDFILIPSRYEPCGLTQLSGKRYGVLPIVRAVGGLEDTVQSYNPVTGDGDGFKFHDFTADAIASTVGWAVHTYYEKPTHLAAMQRRAMQQRFSWTQAAYRYEELYRWALERKRGF